MAERTLLQHASVLTCSGDPAERPFDGDVLIEGDRIAAVAPGRLAVDAGSARVVDLHGATVLPGLCDAHTHISWPLDFVFDHAAVAAAPPTKHALDVAAVVRTFLESGYTLIIGAGVTQPGDDLLAKDAIDRGLIPGPRIVPSGAMITEPGGARCRRRDDGGRGRRPRDAARIVARQCDAGVRAVKLFISGDSIVPAFPSQDSYMNDDMLQAAVDEAERHGAFITVHARGAESVAMAARTGVRVDPPRVLPRRRRDQRARSAARRRVGVPRPALPLRGGQRVRRAVRHAAGEGRGVGLPRRARRAGRRA